MKPECEKCGGNDWLLVESDPASCHGVVMCNLCGKKRFDVSTEAIENTPKLFFRVKL